MKCSLMMHKTSHVTDMQVGVVETLVKCVMKYNLLIVKVAKTVNWVINSNTYDNFTL